MTCLLANFKLPEPDVRLVILDGTVYKIKLRYRGDGLLSDHDEKSMLFWKNAKIQYDIERVIKYVLTNNENIEPVRTDDLVIYPYKKSWENGSMLEFSKYDETFKTFPYSFIFFIEKLKPIKEAIHDQKLDSLSVKVSPEQKYCQNKKSMIFTSSGQKRKISESSSELGSYVGESTSDEEDDESEEKSQGNAAPAGYVQSFFQYLGVLRVSALPVT